MVIRGPSLLSEAAFFQWILNHCLESFFHEEKTNTIIKDYKSPTTFLTIPREIRQAMLIQSFDWRLTLRWTVTNLACVYHRINEEVNVLKRVYEQLAGDIDYVATQWRKEVHNMLLSRKEGASVMIKSHLLVSRPNIATRNPGRVYARKIRGGEVFESA